MNINTLDSRPFWQRAMAIFGAGAICVLAMPPWGFWFVLTPGLGLFYWLLMHANGPRQRFIYGWLFGFGFFGFGLSWIANALLVPGNPFSWIWPLAIAGLPAALGLFYGLGAVMFGPLFRPGRVVGFLAFVLMVCSIEFTRGHIFTGLPWNLYGYTWNAVLPMAQMVSVVGTYGLTLLTVFWLALPAFIVAWATTRPIKIILGGVVAASMVICALWGYGRLANYPASVRDDLVIRIVQPNIAQEDKWNPAKTVENFKTLVTLSTAEKPAAFEKTLILWPETAISQSLFSHDEAVDVMTAMMGSYGSPAYLMTGILRQEKGDYFNSLNIYDAAMDEIASYDKFHLVPFGEYIPFQDALPLKINPFVSFSGFTPGGGLNTLSIPGTLDVGPLVCYEIIFPGATVGSRAERPQLILNVTNDAWYGDSAGPRQHFAKARFRAIEEGIPVARAANTGISGLIDPLGRIEGQAALFERVVITAAVPQALAGPTLYSRTGNLAFFVALGLISATIMALELLRQRR